MLSVTRRDFFTHSATAMAVFSAQATQAEDAQRRFTIALSQYSLRALFRSGKLDPLDFPAFSVDTFGIHAIDLWEGGLPADKLLDKAYLRSIRERAAQAKTELFLLMAGVLDAAPSQRAASLGKLIPSLYRADILGCPFVRIFLKAPGKDERQGIAAAVETLRPLLDIAEKRDVTIAIEPGASPLTQRGTFLAQVARQLDHPRCRLMPDFGKLKQNVYAGTEAMLPYTATVSCKMHSFDDEGNQPDFDYPRLVRMIAASNYRGFLAIEWEGKRLDPISGVKASQQLLHKCLAGV